MRKHATVIFLMGFILLHLYPNPLLSANPRAEVTSFSLSNGLRVILSPVDNIEATCVLLYHLTGVRDDPPEIRGASYLYQNLMQLGTQNLDFLDRILFIKRNGGISNRVVNYDYSIFYQVIPESEINNTLWLESERISSLQLTSKNINTEKNNVYTRNYRLIHSNVHVRASDWVKSKLFAGTIYETPIYGNLEEIRGVNPLAIKKLYSNFRNLSNIIMVICGKFNNKELRKSINKHFGELPPVRGAARNAKKSYTSLGPRTKFVHENWLVPNFSEFFFLYGIPGPAKFNLDHLYFDFIRCYLVDERISKLEEILNRERGLNVTISYEILDYFEASALIIKITAKRRSILEYARYYLNKKLESLHKGTLSNADIKMTKSLMEIDFMKKMTTLETRSSFLAESYHLSGEFNGEENHLKRIRKINTYDIYRIAKKYLEKNNRVNLNVYPKQ
ncbi:MAG: insulinase family protein [Candidatus Aminicenantes bacterium]|nr:MAG: insulinase family protein [Candidatus Aminicenantes bacterium]